MLDKDFDWCYNHENLFREWLHYIYNNRIDYSDLDNDSILSLWQEAKKRALKIANSKEPRFYFRIRYNDMIPNLGGVILLCY